jgi:hypothetical protein
MDGRVDGWMDLQSLELDASERFRGKSKAFFFF